MNRTPSFNFGPPLARIGIWTIVHHNWLAAQIRLYVWLASATVLMLSIASVITLQTALYVLLFGGLGSLFLVWLLIQWRRSILLAIRDEKLKQAALAAMLALICSRQAGVPATDNQALPYWCWVKKKNHP